MILKMDVDKYYSSFEFSKTNNYNRCPTVEEVQKANPNMDWRKFYYEDISTCTTVSSSLNDSFRIVYRY